MDDRAALGDQGRLQDLVLEVGGKCALLVQEQAGEGEQVARVEGRGVDRDAAGQGSALYGLATEPAAD